MLETNTFDSEYFERMQETKITEGDKEVDQWMSGKEVTGIDGVSLVKVQVEQGSLITRPHPKLDPNAASTMTLEPEERLQYARTKETTFKQTTDSTTMNRKKEGEPPETVEVEADKEYKDVLALASKAHNTYNNAIIKTKVDLGKFETNEYCYKENKSKTKH